MDPKGKVILITGASRGIGAVTARRLAAAGMELALCGRDEAKLAEVGAACEAHGAKVVLLPGDIADIDYAEGLPTAAHEAFGRLDAVFNNAGIANPGPTQEADLTEWDKVLDVNFRAWMHLTRHALPLLMEQPESAVINLCSVSGRVTGAGAGIYSATKHAVHAWSQCMFDDVRDKGVKVSAIYPGFVDTDLTQHVAGDRGKMIQPDDVAQTVEFVLRFPGTGCPTEIVIRPQRPIG
jgi:NADP-dependent 3-hydroxy acid dehydrogenase YdfG